MNLTRVADPANKERYRATSVTIGGSGFDWHDMESYFRPDGIGKYSFVGDNEIVFNKSGKQFDAVIMADCSQCPVHPKIEKRFSRIREEANRHRREAWSQAGLVHDMGLQR